MRAWSAPAYSSPRTRGSHASGPKYSGNGIAPSSVSTCVRTGSSLIGSTRAAMPRWRQKSSVISVRRRPAARPCVRSSGAASDLSPSIGCCGPPSAFSMPCSGVALVLGLPAGVRAGDAGERIERGVEIGRERKAEVLVVVAGIDDEREVLAAQAIQAVGELRAADLPAECNHCAHAAMLACSARRKCSTPNWC